MTDQHSEQTSRRPIVVGLTAGLIGGAAAGIAFGVPAITGAAGDDVGTISGLQQPTDDPAVDDDSTVDEDAIEPGARLRALLQPLVDDGTIDAAQADAVAEHLVESGPAWRGHEHGPGHRGPGPGGRGHLESGVVTDLLGIDADELRQQLRDGASLADIATANGVDPADLVDALVAEAQERLDRAVEDERLDADEAAERAADLEERITEMVERTRPARDGAPDADADAD
jgi:hypothetical protein